MIDKRFKIRKLQYNNYEIEHSAVKGQLRLLAIPINILEVPQSALPPGAPREKEGMFMIGTQATVSFTSKSKRQQVRMPTPNDLANAKKLDITAFIATSHEPWNEFILEGNPAILIRTKSILTKLDWIEGFTDPIGGPCLSANHNTNHGVSSLQSGEAGLP